MEIAKGVFEILMEISGGYLSDLLRGHIPNRRRSNNSCMDSSVNP